MKYLLKVIIGIIFFIILISIIVGVYVYINENSYNCDSCSFSISCKMDLTNKTLMVTSVGPYATNWNDIEVIGNASLPIGTIHAGDLITNCSGLVKLVYKPQDKIIDYWNFNEELNK